MRRYFRAFTAVTACLVARAQVYEFTTVAGHPSYGGDNLGYGAPHGYADGVGDQARFYVPSGIAVDVAGNFLVADTFNNAIRRITPAGVVSTVAGVSGTEGGTDGPADSARFFRPEGIAVDSAGNVFIADTQNCSIRRITPDGIVNTIAGRPGGTVGTGDGFGSADGVGAAARFLAPTGIAFDRSGNLFIADRGNHTIRKLTPAGVVTTFAGTAGLIGSADGIGPAARFNSPAGVAVDSNGNVFVGDADNNQIRRITPDGTVSTFAGNASFAANETGGSRFNRPVGLAFDQTGNLIVVDIAGAIRRITPAGIVTTIAGGQSYQDLVQGIPYEYEASSVDSPGIGARFNFPTSVAVDSAGAIFVTDANNNLIRRAGPDGAVSTFAGPGTSNGSADGPGAVARFNFPRGIAVDASGNRYVADTVNHTIRRFGAAGVVTTVAGVAGVSGSADGIGSAARFSFPYAIAVDGGGNLIVADTHNETIRRITPAGAVTTLAGLAGVSGNADGVASVARFNLPMGVAVDRAGNVFVVDAGNGTIRKIAAEGAVTTVATVAATVVFGGGIVDRPTGAAIAVDGTGNVYFADANRVQKLATDGTLSTLAGIARNITRTGDASYGRTDGVGAFARFTAPTGLAVDAAGNVLVADGAIRLITSDGNVTTVGGNGNNGGDGFGYDAGFAQAASVAIDVNGVLWAVDRQNNTVRRGVPAMIPGRLTNFSILAALSPGETLTMGTIIGGAGTGGNKPLLVRAAGPALAPFGITDALPDPYFDFYSGPTKLISIDGWSGIPFAQLGAFPFPNGSRDAAYHFLSLAPGPYTVRVSDATGGGGTVLAEIYDGTTPAMYVRQSDRLINLSVLRRLGSGFTGGFIVGGTLPMRVLIRAVGPSLTPFGVTGALADPRIELFNGSGVSTASNDDWAAAGGAQVTAVSAAFTAAKAFPLPIGSKDAALLATVAPGNHTVQVRRGDGGDGLVLLEVYEVP